MYMYVCVCVAFEVASVVFPKVNRIMSL